MPPPLDWPYIADGQRLDIIALSLDNQHLCAQIHEALERLASKQRPPSPELVEIAQLNHKLHTKNARIQQIAKEARRTQ